MSCAKSLAGGLIFIFLVLIMVGVAVMALFRVYRSAVQYPESEIAASYANYNLPKSFQLNDTYMAQASLNQIYSWYLTELDLKLTQQSIDDCVALEDMRENFIAEWYLSVSMCDVKGIRIVNVSQTFKIGGRIYPPTRFTLYPFFDSSSTNLSRISP